MRRRTKFVNALVSTYGQDTTYGHIKMLARDLGMSVGAVNKWLYPPRKPRYPIMKRIERLTNGRMSLEDW